MMGNLVDTQFFRCMRVRFGTMSAVLNSGKEVATW